MSENPELEVDEEQVDLDPDPAPEGGLGEDDFAPFDYTDSYTDVDPNYVPIVDEGDIDDDEDDEELTEDEIEPPEEDDELVPYWASYEMQGRNLDEGTAWQSLATEPFAGELEVEVEGLTAGARWEFRLRLVDRNGQRSRWSDPLQISLPTDFTPPPSPTAPDVDENTGYITSWWDGMLTGETPKDFSHIVKYLQQMHPEGDPEGEPGDPYKFSTMSSAGAFSVGFLLANVQYRTWYTAVDTSGNESPWSDIVEFTPSKAFNTDELEAELEHLNTERLPELERSLTEEVGKATQAVASFQQEWDENWDPEAMDELRGRADATEAEVATAKAEAEQAKQDAATAQANAKALEGRADATDAEVATAKAEAEQAKRDAEAAQARASAVEAQANSLDTRIQEGLANAEQSVRSLAVTGPRNINSDPKFETLSNDDIHSWRSATDDWYRTSLSWGSPNREFVRISDDALAEGMYAVSYGGNGPVSAILECLPGETFKARFQVARYSGWSLDDDYRLEFRWIDGERNGIGWSRINFGTYDNQAWVEEEVTAPEGAAYFYYRFTKVGTTSSARGVGNVSVRPMTTGDLTVDGTMLARHVDMEDFTADAGFINNAFVNLIQGKMANFDQALIGGALLKDNSVATRHMVVGNTDELWNDAWWEDLLDNAYIFSPGGTADSAVFGRNFQSENPPGLGGGSFDWRYTTLQGDRGIQAWPTNSSLHQRAAFRLGPGKGIPVRPGEKYTFRARYRDANGSGFFNIDMALFDVETGDPVPVADVPRFVASGIVNSGDEESIWTFEIPGNFPRMHMVPSIHSQSNSVSGARSVLRPQLFRAMDGKLIVDGLLQATTAELQELFFDTAVGNAIAAGSGQFLELDADQIRSNSWTGQVMTGPVMQSHSANNTGWRIEPGQGLRMWDGGRETLRLNGSDNHLEGSLTIPTGSSETLQLRAYRGQEIFSNGVRDYYGMGFSKPNERLINGMFIEAETGQLNLSSGTDADSAAGRPYGWMGGGWEVQWLRPSGRLETFNTAVVGREVEVTLYNGYRASSITGIPRYVRLGDWVMLSGAIQPRSSTNVWSLSIAFVPPPNRLVRVSTSLLRTSGANESVGMYIDELGLLRINGGADINFNAVLSLDGIVYKI